MDQIEATIVLMKEDIVATIRDLKQIIIGSRFKSFSKFKKYYKAQDKFCHCTVSWLTPRLCIECHDCETVKNSVMCIDCFIAGNHLNHNYSIKTLPFGSCHCGRSFLFKNNSCFCPHHQISTDQTKHEIPEENIIRSILEVLIKQLPKVGTVYNSEKVIKFILSIARISDSFLEIVADCFIHQMKVIFKIFNKSPIFRPLFNEKFIKLVNCLSVNHAFAISSILFFLHFSQYLVIDQFLCMSGEKKNKNYRHISGLLNFPEPYLLLILFKGYDWTSFSISFIDNFQDILNDIQFIHKPKYFPFFYKNIFKAIRIFLLNDVENNVQDIFDNLLEIIARTQLRIKIKYDESNLLIHKVPYYLHWTGSILKLLDNQEINLDELFELVDCLFQNSFSDNEFDEIINENQNENQNQNNEEIETKGNDNLYEANEESSEYKKYFRSILDKGVNITVFNQILHIFFILITRVTPIISLNNQLSENVIIYGSIISSRFFSLYLSAKLGSITGDDDTFCSLANKIGNKAHLSLIRSNFGFLQIASLLSDNKEQIMRLIAESLGIFTCKDCDQSTMKLCFIFIIGCLYFDRTSSLNYSKKEIKKLQAIHKLKKAPLHLKNLTRKEIDEIKDVSIRLKLKDGVIFKLNNEVKWNPFSLVNSISETMTLLSREITTHSLFYIYDQLENVENNSENAENIGNNENNGNTQLEKFQRCDFGSFLETPTVYAIAYSILCDYVHDKKGIEAVHLVLNLILILIKRNHNYSDVSNENESISAKNLNQLVSKMPYYFNTFLILKIQFLDYPEFSLLDLISKTTLKLTIFEQLSKQEFPLSLYYFDEKGNNMNNNTSSNIESKNQIITSLKDKIKKEFNDRNHLFITNSSNFELLQDEELNEVCQICELGGENETLCYSTYLYQTNLPSKFELDGPRKEIVFQFSLCDHLVHLNCIFPNSGQVENEFRCPIDRFQKNLIIPKVDSFIEPTDNMRFAIENFLILFAQPFDVLLKSFTGIIILNEVRARFSSIEVKYSNQRLLARTLFYILWHAVKIFEMEIDESTLQYKTSIFQRFVYSLITQNVLTVDLFISLVKKSSCSLKSKEKCLFLRRCRILEHFVFDAKSETEVFESVRNSILKPINLYSYYGISENDLLEENCNKVVVSDDEILDEHEFANQNQNSNQNQQIDIPIQPDDVENQNQNDNHTQNCTILENLTGDFQFNTDFFRNNFPDDFLMICQKISMQNQSRIASFDMTTSKMVQKGTRSILELMIECEDDPIPRLAFIFGKENTMTYIQYRKNFMPLNSIYVDSDGEPDEGLKRERPVFFSQENYETAVDALLSGDFAQNLITIYQ